MIYGIIQDTNTTNRLLADAFLSHGTRETTAPQTTEREAVSLLPSEVAIVTADLSEKAPTITNYTSYTVDEKELAERKLSFYSYGESPLVLVLHTHPREAYAPSGSTCVASDHLFEESDPQQNIFAVGEEICRLLTATGIGTLHITEEITDPDKIIKDYLTRYPSLRFVLDIHRDGLYTSDGRIVATKGELDGMPAAQLMLAVGTGASNERFDYQDNLAAAYALSTMITEAEEDLMRPILLRPEGLHQQHAPCSLSLYVGTTGNTLEEALRSSRFFARYLAIFILNTRGYA